MIDDRNKLYDILKKSLSYTYELRISENYSKSAKFLYEFSKNIKDEFFVEGTELKVQKVEDNGKKSPGEWLYDACIIEEKIIKDETGYKKETWCKIPVKVFLSIESEFNTSLKSFADDFGKLVCSNSEQILYIAGLNQKDERKKFIDRRINMINKYLLNYLNNLILIFFPSPEKNKYLTSIWDEYSLDELCSWIQIYSYNKNENVKLIKHNLKSNL
jgi:hypothetical protein